MTEISVCRVADYVPVSKLNFHPDNPRTIRRDRLDALKHSIVKKGFYEPILVHKGENTVLAGNHRLKAVLELLDEGHTLKTPGKRKDGQVPVVYEDCDDETAWSILYESNNHYVEWIDEKLKTALLDAEEEGRNLLETGFDEVRLAELLDTAERQAEAVERTLVETHTRKSPERKESDETSLDDHCPVEISKVSCPECGCSFEPGGATS